MDKKEENSMATLAHVLGIVVGFLGPLIMLLSIDNENVKKHCKIVLNWQISLAIYILISFVLMLVFIGILLVIALAVLNLVFGIQGAIHANKGEFYKYPLSIQFIHVD